MKASRASDWIESGEPQSRIDEYNKKATKPIKPTAGLYATLDYILRQADPDGTNMFPAAPKIAAATWQTTRSVFTHLTNLVTLGLIERDDEPRSPMWHEIHPSRRPVAYRALYGPVFARAMKDYQSKSAGAVRRTPRGELRAV